MSVPLMSPPSGDTNRDWLGSPDHAALHRNGDGSLTLLTRQRTDPQSRADGGFIGLVTAKLCELAIWNMS